MKKINKRNLFIFFIAFVQLVMFCCYTYGDIIITTIHGMSFWDCLFSGHIRDFYKINFDDNFVAGRYTAGYDFVIYIIFAIWDFPLWVCRRFEGVEYPLNSFLGSLWAKSIIILFYILTLIILQKFLKKCSFNDKGLLIILMTTSIFISAYLGIIGQYDIITVFFIMLGIYYLICDKFLLFVLFFSIAIPIKIFALMVFVPILLLYEKRIIKVMCYLFLSMVPMIMFRMLIPMVLGESNVNAFLEYLFINNIPLGTYKVSLFCTFYISLLFFCLWKKCSDDTLQFAKDIVYISFLSYFIFFAFAYSHPFWMIYLVPYIYIIICMNKKCYGMNILLEICMTFFVVIAQSIDCPHVFSSDACKFGEHNGYFTMIDFLKLIAGENGVAIAQDYLSQACWSFFIVSGIFFAVLNCPWIKEKKLAEKLNCRENLNVLYFIRLLCLLIVYAIPCLWVFQ